MSADRLLSVIAAVGPLLLVFVLPSARKIRRFIRQVFVWSISPDRKLRTALDSPERLRVPEELAFLHIGLYLFWASWVANLLNARLLYLGIADIPPQQPLCCSKLEEVGYIATLAVALPLLPSLLGLLAATLIVAFIVRLYELNTRRGSSGRNTEKQKCEQLRQTQECLENLTPGRQRASDPSIALVFSTDSSLGATPPRLATLLFSVMQRHWLESHWSGALGATADMYFTHDGTPRHERTDLDRMLQAAMDKCVASAATNYRALVPGSTSPLYSGRPRAIRLIFCDPGEAVDPYATVGQFLRRFGATGEDKLLNLMLHRDCRTRFVAGTWTAAGEFFGGPPQKWRPCLQEFLRAEGVPGDLDAHAKLVSRFHVGGDGNDILVLGTDRVFVGDEALPAGPRKDFGALAHFVGAFEVLLMGLHFKYALPFQETMEYLLKARATGPAPYNQSLQRVKGVLLHGTP